MCYLECLSDLPWIIASYSPVSMTCIYQYIHTKSDGRRNIHVYICPYIHKRIYRNPYIYMRISIYIITKWIQQVFTTRGALPMEKIAENENQEETDDSER